MDRRSFIVTMTIILSVVAVLLSLIAFGCYTSEQNNHKDEHIQTACIAQHGEMQPLSGTCEFRGQ